MGLEEGPLEAAGRLREGERGGRLRESESGGRLRARVSAAAAEGRSAVLPKSGVWLAWALDATMAVGGNSNVRTYDHMIIYDQR